MGGSDHGLCQVYEYKVRINSMETETFILTRGLRQGDPLSPYLFLLVAEGLSSLLKGAKSRGELQGVRVCRNAPVVSHLLFADDSLILMEASRENAVNLQVCLIAIVQTLDKKLVMRSAAFSSVKIQM